MLPVTILFLLIAIASLAFKAHVRNGYLPFAIGIMAALMIMMGKFLYINNFIRYAGIIMLIISSTWNAWPRRGTVDNIGKQIQ